MKKRKKPILLGTMLVMCLAVAFAMNYVFANPRAIDDFQKAREEATHSDDKLADKHEGVSNSDTKQASNAFKKPVPKSQIQDSSMIPGAPGSSIKKPGSAAPYRPTPNDSQTNQQWYTKEFGYKGKTKG